MKINEVMAEASVDRKQFGKETVRANQKANIARSAAFRAQMDAKPEEPAAATPAAAPAAAATPSGPVNYGKGTPGIPNIQVTPGIKTPQPAAKPGTQASPTPNYGAKPGQPVTLANPIAKPGAATPGPTAGTPGADKPGATPTPGAAKPGLTPVPGAGMPTPPGAGMPKPVTKTPGATAPANDANTGWKGKGAGGNLPGASFLKGFTKAAGMTDATNAIDAAQRSNIDYDLMAKQKAKADADKAGQPQTQDSPIAEPAGAETPATGKSGELSPGASKPGATPSYGPKAAQPITLANPIGQPGAAKPGAAPAPGTAKPGAEKPGATPGTAKPGEPVTLDDPAAKAGAATPGQPQTQDSPIAKPGAEKPGAAKPAAAPAPATAAKGKTMSKQEILAWISRNDEDNAALQSFKDGITAAEKSGAPADANYGKATPGIQNVQATPGKVSYAPKTAAAAPKGPATVSASMPQPQMASKQYKKAPL